MSSDSFPLSLCVCQVTGGVDSYVKIWDTRLARGIATLQGFGGEVMCVSFESFLFFP
jgi:hypothetical protein